MQNNNVLPASYRDYAGTDPDQEIDLLELVEKLYTHKVMILTVTAIAALFALVIAFSLPKSYTTEAIINETQAPELQSINSITPYISSQTGFESNISTEYVYGLYQKILTSPATTRYAFEASSLSKPEPGRTEPLSKEELANRYQAFSKNLTVNADKNSSRIHIKYTSSSPAEAAYLINQVLLPYVQKQVTASLEKDRKALISLEERSLGSVILHTENNFMASTRNRLTELQEALTQAEAAGITEMRAGEITPTIVKDATYLLGEKLLRSRIDVIQNRLNNYRFHSSPNPETDADKPYIRGIADKVFRLERLKALELNFSSLEPVTIEQSAAIPHQPTKPNKKMILALGTILGGMLGIFIALIRIAIESRKERKKHEGHQYSMMAGHTSSDRKVREYSDSGLHPEPAHPDAR